MLESRFMHSFLNGIQLYLGSLGIVALVNGHYPQAAMLLSGGCLILWQLGRR